MRTGSVVLTHGLRLSLARQGHLFQQVSDYRDNVYVRSGRWCGDRVACCVQHAWCKRGSISTGPPDMCAHEHTLASFVRLYTWPTMQVGLLRMCTRDMLWFSR